MSAVLIVVLVLVLVLAVGGAFARRRQLAATQDRFLSSLEEVNHDFAAARAQDRGWDPVRLEAAARAAAGGTPDAIELWRVVDRPGTDQDQAVFRVLTGGEESFVTLGRRGDEWVAQPGE